MQRSIWVLAVLTALVLAGPATAAGAVNVSSSAAGISFDAQGSHAGSVLTVTGPEGIAVRKSFDSGSAFFSIGDAGLDNLPDGLYTYELVLTPQIDRATREALLEARAAGIDAGDLVNSSDNVVSGYFRIVGGALVTGQGGELSLESTSAAASAGGGLESVSGNAQVIATDLVVQGSECVGFDCVNGESFGSDTIRLKENNLRIHFNDTSNSASFPTRDWRIEINSNANGGADYFAIQDSDAGTYPFRIIAGAGNNAVYVDAQGDVGLNTANPVVELHIADGDTPTMRLEQNQSSGFAAQTWDVAGNETNFFVRDVSNGSALPFRIFPGNGADDGIVLTSDGDVGMGTDSPSAALHIRSNNDANDQDFLVEEVSSTEAARVLATLRNNGRTLLLFEDTSADGEIWRLRAGENVFTIDSDARPGNELTINGDNGNVTILGILNENSNREAKSNIEPVNAAEVLQKVAALPLSTWTYKKDQESKHLGPMAQDFHAAFGLGPNNTGLASYDTAGVALAAIQALNQQLEQKQTEIELLKARLEALEAKVSD